MPFNTKHTRTKISQGANHPVKTSPNSNQGKKKEITSNINSPIVANEISKANNKTNSNPSQQNTTIQNKSQNSNLLKQEHSHFKNELSLSHIKQTKSSQNNSNPIEANAENIKTNSILDVNIPKSRTNDISSIPDSSELLITKSSIITETAQLDSAIEKDSIPQKMALRKLLNRSFLQIYSSNGVSSSQVDLNSDFANQFPYQNNYETLKDKSKTGSSFGFGINYGREIRRHQFGIGLNYQSISYKIPVVNVEGGIINSSTSGIGRFNYNATDSFKVESEENGASFVNSRYQFIQIPVFYSFNLINYKRFSFNISNSLAYAMLIKSEGLVQNNSSGLYLKPEKSDDNTITKSHFAYSISPEFTYKIKNRLHLQISPFFQTSLNPIEKGFIRTNYQLIGINTGILFYLK